MNPPNETSTRVLQSNRADGPVLEARDIVKQFKDSVVVDHVSLRVAPGDRTAIIGRSGSGKTTFLRCLNLLETPTSGELDYRGSMVGRWSPVPRECKAVGSRELARHRARVGMVFQRFELFPHLRVLDNVTLGPRRTLGLSRSEAEQQATELLARVGLQDKLEDRPHQLSGGQQQRVAIARTLAMRPDVILFDEPTSALDPELVGEVLKVILELALSGMTMVIVTHEIAFARDVANRLMVFDRGEVVEDGNPAEIIAHPRSEATQSLLQRLRASEEIAAHGDVTDHG